MPSLVPWCAARVDQVPPDRTSDLTSDLTRLCVGAQCPQLQPFPGDNSVVLIDGASIHKSWRAIRAILDTGALVRFLEPYDPVHMPIEFGFRAMKQFLRQNRNGLMHFGGAARLSVAAAMVSRASSRNAYHECGY